MAEDSEGGRKLRTKERKKYIDQEIDEDDIDGRRTYNVEDKLISDKFTADMVQELKGPDFTMEWMQKHGLMRPIVFYDKAGLGLRVPSENFKVSDVKQCVGSRRILDVMDVTTQKAMEMSMKDWVKYYENPERDRLLNVISLEFCHTRLENYVESPTLVRQMDWVDRAWPRHLKECQTESTNVIEKMKYPKVQKYCLMSVAGCYTDFHIDFGGTSVWYHILHGEKIFWLAPPSQKNIDRYVEWTLSAKQGDTFLGDVLEQCQRITLEAGYTFIIPSGWIHAVYTPKDSLVFGGNFLHSFNIENQLLVSRIEDKTYVPSKFRYPFYSEIMWYVVDRYISCLTGRTYLVSCEKDDFDEDDQGLIQVDEDSRPPSRNPDSRPPSRAMDDSLDTKVKSESGEDTPKLSKSVTIELTRIDAALKRSQSEEENQPPHARSRVPRKAISDPNSAWEGGGGSKKWIHLTTTELRGLRHLVEYLCGLMALPSSKRGVPKEMPDPEAVLREIKQVLEDHKNDDQELAISGEPAIGWPESARKKQQKLKLGYKTFKTAKAAKGSSSSSSVRRRRTRCKQCEACTRTECGECTFCKDMKKFGGPGRMKQTCISRQCMAPILPSSSVCMICNQEGQHNTDDPDDISVSLMECGICWEIMHPACLQKKYENLDNEGVINEDLPNSWECSRCCNEGKQGQLKPRVRPGYSSKKVKAEDHRFSADSDGSQEEEPLSPISPVEGKRVVSKEGNATRNGEGPFSKLEIGPSKWPSPPKKFMTFSDVKVKTEDGVAMTPPALSSFSSLHASSRDENAKKRNQPQNSSSVGGHKDQKKQIKKEKMSAPTSPPTPQHDESSRNPRKRTPATSGSSGDKNTPTSQADAMSKRPKRENGLKRDSVFSDMKCAKSTSNVAKVSSTISTRASASAVASRLNYATLASDGFKIPFTTSTCLTPSPSNTSSKTNPRLSRSASRTRKKTRHETMPVDTNIISDESGTVSTEMEDVVEDSEVAKFPVNVSKTQFGRKDKHSHAAESVTNPAAKIQCKTIGYDLSNHVDNAPLSIGHDVNTNISSTTDGVSNVDSKHDCITELESNSTSFLPFSSSPPPPSSSSSALEEESYIIPADLPQHHELFPNSIKNTENCTFKQPLPKIHCAKVIYIKANPITRTHPSHKAVASAGSPGLQPTAGKGSNAENLTDFPPLLSVTTSPTDISESLVMAVRDVYHPVIYDHTYCNLSSYIHI